MRKKYLQFLFSICIFSSLSFASLDITRTPEQCEAALFDRAESLSDSDVKSGVLMPLSTFFLSTKDPFLALLWRVADTVERQSISPGLGRLMNSARLASEAILEEMPEAKNAVRPSYPVGNLIEGYEATQRLILEGHKNIREAVLVRNGVVTIVPLLKRIIKKSGKTRLPVYLPIIARGHQDVENWDIFSASFASWALEVVQQQLPPEALVYNKPMQKIRRNVKKHLVPFSSINPLVHLPHLERTSHEIVEAFESLEIAKQLEPGRSTAAGKSRYISYIRKLLNERESLWMLPLPPNAFERDRLVDMGYGDMKLLARLKINSIDFFRVAARSGINPMRLRKYVARCRAKAEDRVIVLESFPNPFLDVDGKDRWRLHIDFEDITDPEIRGGVYLVGYSIQSPNGKIVEEGHFFADKKQQRDFDVVMAELFSLVKEHPKLAGREPVITVYSHHEETKIEQFLDIVKDKSEKFTKKQRASNFYFEKNIGTVERPKYEGVLIRNEKFYADNKDLEPSDLFESLLPQMLDLLPYFRNNIITGNYTSSLKRMVVEFGDDQFHVEYPPGHNGLEVGVWVDDYWQTGNPRGKEKAIYYVGEDVTGNVIASRALEKYADRPVDADFQWSKTAEKSLPSLTKAISLSSTLGYLHLKIKLLEKILGKPLKELSSEQYDELQKSVDMSLYLAIIAAVREDSTLTDLEKKRILQQRKVEFENSRATQMLDFFEKINPKLNRSRRSPELHKALSELLIIPSVYLRESHIDKMLIVVQLEKVTPDTKSFKRINQSLEWPEEWELAYREFLASIRAEESPYQGWKSPHQLVRTQTYRDLWKALYYSKFFELPELSEN